MGRAARWALAILLLLALVLLALWTQRQPLAENFIERELNRRGVTASYDVAAIGLRTQRIEHIVLGDPANPDLTADWAEVDIALSGVTPQVAAVRAGGVRMRGRLHDGVLDLGALDAFRQPGSNAPFALPDVELGLSDARMRLDTDFGPVGLKLDGDGNLRSGFRGKLAAVAPRVALAGCTVAGMTAYVDIGVDQRRPRLSGPIRARTLACPDSGFALAAPRLKPDITFASTLDRWTGTTAVAADAMRGPAGRLSGLSGRIAFDGTKARTAGEMRLAGKALQGGGLDAQSADLAGTWSAGNAKGGLAASLSGSMTAKTITGGRDPLGSLRSALAGSPVGPLAARLADAVRDASAANRLTARFALTQHGGAGGVVVSALDFSSRSGAQAGLGQGARFTYSWPQGQWALDGGVRIEGGGLPRAALRLAQRPGGGFGGQAFIERYVAGDAKLALTPIRFAADKSGATRFSTRLMLDGPLPGGAVRGLTLPLGGAFTADGRFALNPACAPLSFAALRFDSLTLDRTRLTLCPTQGALLAYGLAGLKGGGAIEKPLLTGRIGESALRISAGSARFGLAARDLALQDLQVAIGPAERPVRMSAASLDGVFRKTGLAGHLSGATAKIGTVPLLVGDATGSWAFADRELRLDAGLTLTDAAAPDRFEPLVSRDFALALRNNRITAHGTLRNPQSDAVIAIADIAHDLQTARGNADLAVPGITFTPALQPEMVSRLALGVIANARGTVTGAGHVRWTGTVVTSEGLFGTDHMDLAAAFGPVKGLSGQIRFTDLLNMITAPRQTAHIASVNPGTLVADGVIHYQLIAGQRVRIEDGAWPFAGGRLTLLPTTLDFGADKSRLLTFRVVGLDAGAFINTLDLQNISATGTFDGLLPMIFDANGGRIHDGLLVARQTGLPPLVLNDSENLQIPCDRDRQAGTLAYVGPVSNEQLGVYGKMAFDALKNLQYKCLTILMDGALDGEMVTQVSFNGVNRSPLGSLPTGIARNFVGLPFIFNISISAPFRGLLNTAQSFSDPGQLIRTKLGDDYAPVTTVAPKSQIGVAVQPMESDTKISGGPK